MRLLRVRTADPQSAIESTRQLYESATAALPPSQVGPIEARFDLATGSLILVGAEAAVDRFARLFEQSQQIAAPARTTRLLDVRQVDAAALVEQLQTLLETAGPIDPGRIAPSPTIEVVASSNSLMITAEPAQHELITRLVERLDRLEPADLPPLRLFQLRSSDAESVAQILRRQFDRRPPAERVAKPVVVQADAATNTLVVSAGDEALAQIRTVVDQLNESRSLDADGREIRIFPLRVARAPELARVIDEMYPQPPAPVDIRGRVRPDLQPPREIVVRADPVSNSLIVDAPAARMAEFEQIVRQLDQQQVAGDVELRTYRLRRANIDAAARTLRELAAAKALGASGVSAAAAPVTVATEPVTRTLVISAPTAAFAEIDRVLDELDASADRPATALRLYPLRHARAQRMVGLLDGLLSARLRDIIERDPDLAALPGGTRSLLELAADAPSNTLIISAPPDIQTIAAELIAAFDRPDSAVGRRAVRVVPLTSANAVQTSQAIRGAMAAMDLPSGLRPGEPGAATVEPVPSGNALLISGPENDLNELEAIAASLDIRPKDELHRGPRRLPQTHTSRNHHADRRASRPQRFRARHRAGLGTHPAPARPSVHVGRAHIGRGPRRRRPRAQRRSPHRPGRSGRGRGAGRRVARRRNRTHRRGRPGLRVITIENADASEVAQTVEAILAEDARDATSAAPPVIRVDALKRHRRQGRRHADAHYRRAYRRTRRRGRRIIKTTQNNQARQSTHRRRITRRVRPKDQRTPRSGRRRSHHHRPTPRTNRTPARRRCKGRRQTRTTNTRQPQRHAHAKPAPCPDNTHHLNIRGHAGQRGHKHQRQRLRRHHRRRSRNQHTHPPGPAATGRPHRRHHPRTRIAVPARTNTPPRYLAGRHRRRERRRKPRQRIRQTYRQSKRRQPRRFHRPRLRPRRPRLAIPPGLLQRHRLRTRRAGHRRNSITRQRRGPHRQGLPPLTHQRRPRSRRHQRHAQRHATRPPGKTHPRPHHRSTRRRNIPLNHRPIARPHHPVPGRHIARRHRAARRHRDDRQTRRRPRPILAETASAVRLYRSTTPTRRCSRTRAGLHRLTPRPRTQRRASAQLHRRPPHQHHRRNRRRHRPCRSSRTHRRPRCPRRSRRRRRRDHRAQQSKAVRRPRRHPRSPHRSGPRAKRTHPPLRTRRRRPPRPKRTRNRTRTSPRSDRTARSGPRRRRAACPRHQTPACRRRASRTHHQRLLRPPKPRNRPARQSRRSSQCSLHRRRPTHLHPPHQRSRHRLRTHPRTHRNLRRPCPRTRHAGPHRPPRQRASRRNPRTPRITRGIRERPRLLVVDVAIGTKPRHARSELRRTHQLRHHRRPGRRL